ncbi:MAG: hypothetical protein ABSH10_09165 [Phycisphaerae bacterium]|jgi:hypothetical protein
MLGIILIVAGVILMILGGILLLAWTGDPSRWFDAAVHDNRGTTKTDRQFLDLYFLAMVIAPLLVGGLLIALGLRQIL